MASPVGLKQTATTSSVEDQDAIPKLTAAMEREVESTVAPTKDNQDEMPGLSAAAEGPEKSDVASTEGNQNPTPLLSSESTNVISGRRASIKDTDGTASVEARSSLAQTATTSSVDDQDAIPKLTPAMEREVGSTVAPTEDNQDEMPGLSAAAEGPEETDVASTEGNQNPTPLLSSESTNVMSGRRASIEDTAGTASVEARSSLAQTATTSSVDDQDAIPKLTEAMEREVESTVAPTEDNQDEMPGLSTAAEGPEESDVASTEGNQDEMPGLSAATEGPEESDVASTEGNQDEMPGLSAAAEGPEESDVVSTEGNQNPTPLLSSESTNVMSGRRASIEDTAGTAYVEARTSPAQTATTSSVEDQDAIPKPTAAVEREVESTVAPTKDNQDEMPGLSAAAERPEEADVASTEGNQNLTPLLSSESTNVISGRQASIEHTAGTASVEARSSPDGTVDLTSTKSSNEAHHPRNVSLELNLNFALLENESSQLPLQVLNTDEYVGDVGAEVTIGSHDAFEGEHVENSVGQLSNPHVQVSSDIESRIMPGRNTIEISIEKTRFSKMKLDEARQEAAKCRGEMDAYKKYAEELSSYAKQLVMKMQTAMDEREKYKAEASAARKEMHKLKELTLNALNDIRTHQDKQLLAEKKMNACEEKLTVSLDNHAELVNRLKVKNDKVDKHERLINYLAYHMQYSKNKKIPVLRCVNVYFVPTKKKQLLRCLELKDVNGELEFNSTMVSSSPTVVLDEQSAPKTTNTASMSSITKDADKGDPATEVISPEDNVTTTTDPSISPVSVDNTQERTIKLDEHKTSLSTGPVLHAKRQKATNSDTKPTISTRVAHDSISKSPKSPKDISHGEIDSGHTNDLSPPSSKCADVSEECKKIREDVDEIWLADVSDVEQDSPKVESTIENIQLSPHGLQSGRRRFQQKKKQNASKKKKKQKQQQQEQQQQQQQALQQQQQQEQQKKQDQQQKQQEQQQKQQEQQQKQQEQQQQQQQQQNGQHQHAQEDSSFSSIEESPRKVPKNFELQTSRRHHSKAITSLALHPDGLHVVSASDDGAWCLVPPPKEGQRPGKAVIRNTDHKDYVSCAAFLPCLESSVHLATASGDGTVRVWNLDENNETAACTQRLAEHGSHVWWCAWQPRSNSYLASCDIDGKTMVWDVHTGQRAVKLEGHGFAPINSVQFNEHNPQQLVTCSADTKVRIWDLRTMKSVYEFSKHGACVNYATYDPFTGNRIASCDSHGRVMVWDVRATHVLQCEQPHPHARRSTEFAGVNHLAFDPTGVWLAFASDSGEVPMCNVNTGELAYLKSDQRMAAPVQCVLFGREGDFLLSGGVDLAMKVWN